MRGFFALTFSVFILIANAQPSQKKTITTSLQRPKLVIGIVVDQMRWDYLYRYYDRFGNNGFKRLLSQGFSCENTFINYLPSYTAVGHSSIFTGSVPAIHGITGNDWIIQSSGEMMYCTDDSTVQSVGTYSDDGKMSPRNLLVSTVTDELRMATNYQSKVVGISLKDRAAILPAGHTATAAFWLDDTTGNFITSSYYMQTLPDWVKNFNDQKRIDQLISNKWNTLYPINTYAQSDKDEQSYEGKYPGESTTIFPHDIKEAYKKKKSTFRQTPFGNTLTLEFASRALDAYQLGKGNATDFLTINFASTDYVGHMYGINSIEVEDTYLRLDKELDNFLQMLDARIGKGEYVVFLTADHGAAHAIGYMQNHRLPADYWNPDALKDSINARLLLRYDVDKLVSSIYNYQVNFDMDKIYHANLGEDEVKRTVMIYLKGWRRNKGIAYVVNVSDVKYMEDVPLPEPLKTMVVNGYNRKRSGPIQIILEPGWFESHGKTGTTHGSWNPYDTHIPLLFYGWKIPQGKTNRRTEMTDIAPTISALLHIQMPNGCIGKVIEEVVK